MEHDDDLKYWVAFSKIPKIGATRLAKLCNYFSSMREAWRASFSDLLNAGIEEKIINEFISCKDSINLEAEWEKLEKENIKIVTINNNNYPKLLKEIWNPPSLLYYKGTLPSDEEFAIGVVGTRKISNYGKQITPQIIKDLVKNNLIIISGLALGVDSLAHKTTIDCGGKTVAVLGSGIDEQSIYPSQNRYLALEIIESGGAVVSEYPLGALALPINFPYRNRIISGLSLGTLVVEAAEESGALITAKYALDQNREVFAIPGSIFNPFSFGPNKLIKMGAKAVTSVDDILETLNLANAIDFSKNRKIIPESPEEEKILNILTQEPTHIDKIILASGLDAAKVGAILTLMEMKGLIKNLGGMNYVSIK